MKKLKRFGILLGAPLLAISITACQGVAVPSGKVAILVDDYAVWPADAAIFDCQDPETTEQYWNVREFDYPTRQISYEASPGYKDSDGNGLVDSDSPAERPSFVVVSNASAPAELTVPVTVTFDLTSNCEDLKTFHREFGSKYLPNNQDKIDVDTTTQWIDLLNYVIGQPLEQVLIRVSQKYGWREIWNDEKVRAEYVKALQDSLPQEAAERTLVDGKPKEFFSNFRVTVGKPDPLDQGLKDSIIAEQKAIADARATEAKGVADARAAQAKAEADIATARAQTELARQVAAQKAAEIAGFGTGPAALDAWLRDQCQHIGSSCQMYNPSPIIAGAR